MRIAAAITTVFLLAACGQSPEPAPAAPAPPAGSPVAGAALPVGSHSVSGRLATVVLPFRGADGLAWVAATEADKARPFAFKGLEVKPGEGPGGSDLAVFTYEAAAPGSARLEFGLVPAGRMLVGPPDQVFTGSVAKTYTAAVTAE